MSPNVPVNDHSDSDGCQDAMNHDHNGAHSCKDDEDSHENDGYETDNLGDDSADGHTGVSNKHSYDSDDDNCSSSHGNEPAPNGSASIDSPKSECVEAEVKDLSVGSTSQSPR